MEQSTIETLRDLESIISISFSALAIFTAISIAYVVNWRRLRKSLVLVVRAYSPIFTVDVNTAVDKKVRDNVQILYNGVEVQNSRFYVIEVINNGNQTIEKKDFDKSLDLVFSADAKILSAEIKSVSPENLAVTRSIEGNKISIEPLLLNKGDSFVIKGITNSLDSTIKCDARISGIKKVKLIAQEFRFSNSKLQHLSISAVCWLIFVVGVSLKQFGIITSDILLGFIVISILLVGSFWILIDVIPDEEKYDFEKND